MQSRELKPIQKYYFASSSATIKLSDLDKIDSNLLKKLMASCCYQYELDLEQMNYNLMSQASNFGEKKDFIIEVLDEKINPDQWKRSDFRRKLEEINIAHIHKIYPYCNLSFYNDPEVKLLTDSEKNDLIAKCNKGFENPLFLLEQQVAFAAGVVQGQKDEAKRIPSTNSIYPFYQSGLFDRRLPNLIFSYLDPSEKRFREGSEVYIEQLSPKIPKKPGLK